MLLQQTLTQLRELRLTGMADALDEQQAVPDIQSLTFEDRLALLVEGYYLLQQNTVANAFQRELAGAKNDAA